MPNSAIVYVVNEPLRRDPETGAMDRIVDLTPAQRFGKLKHLLAPGTMMHNIDFVRDELHKGLANFTQLDYLLLVGNPVAIMMAGAIALDRTDGRLNVLRWHARSRQYESLLIDIWPEEELENSI